MVKKKMTVRIVGLKDNVSSKELFVDTTTRSKNWSKFLSPMKVGPIISGKERAKNMENFWQFSKVYSDQVDENKIPTADYYDWRKKGFDDDWAHRYPKGKGAIPLYSWYKNQSLDYIEARKRLYIIYYAKAVVKTSAFQKLLKLYLENGSITLFDYDGYDYHALGYNLSQVINDPNRKMGHAFVLAGLLETYKRTGKIGFKV